MARPPADAPLLSAEKITAQALKMLDQDGLDGLSMRKLAAELKVSPKSLYHYFPTKEDLLEGVYAQILREIEWPTLSGGPWQERFRKLAHSLRQSMLRHATFILYYFQAHRVSAEELDAYEALYTLLADAGVPEEIISEYGSVLIIFLVGFCYSELNGNFAPEAFSQRKAYAKQQPGRFPLAKQLPMPERHDAAERFFALALDSMIAGIEEQAHSGQQ